MTHLNKRRLGADGEGKAVQFLLKQNYKILKTNFRVGRLGEIDIIARIGEYICFIEVKTRRSLKYGTPGEAVTALKQKKIKQLASIFLSKKFNANQYIRFDVIEIILSQQKNTTEEIVSINHIINAF